MSERAIHVCQASEVSPGNQKIVQIKNVSLGIFQVGDEYFALLNICPHRGGQLCQGPQCGTTLPTDEREYVYGRSDEIVRCAWHGWEFDIRTGQALASPGVKARTFEVSVDGDDLYVHI